MIVYIIAGVLILLGLVVAYRTLGAEAVQNVDPAALLRATLAAAEALERELDGVLAAGMPLDRNASSPARAAVHSVRRKLDGCAQQGARIDVAALRDTDADVHTLLGVALDELVWSARLAESEAFTSAQGMQRAVDELRRHASACLRDARTLLEPSAMAKEVERAR